MFNIGDRVVIVKPFFYPNTKGKKATIIKVRNNGDSYAIEYDENINGHRCEGLCKNGHGEYIRADKLELLREETNRSKLREGLLKEGV